MEITRFVETLKTSIEEMAQGAEEIFALAVVALNSRSPEAAAAVAAKDRALDELEMKIDELCMEILALREPLGGQFRYAFSGVKLTRELERVGDECKTVAKWSVRLPAPAGPELTALAAKAGDALQAAVRAIRTNDRAAAEQVMELEFQVDDMEDRIIESQPSLAEAFIAKALERIGDLATNIAEAAIFNATAQDIRHGHFGPED